MKTICNGIINHLGYCDKCYQSSQTTSGYCTRLIDVPNQSDEITDDMIEKKSKEYHNVHGGYHPDFASGAKWMRTQMNKK